MYVNIFNLRGKYLLLNFGWRVVFRANQFDHLLDKVLIGHQHVKAPAAVLHTSFQHLKRVSEKEEKTKQAK